MTAVIRTNAVALGMLLVVSATAPLGAEDTFGYDLRATRDVSRLDLAAVGKEGHASDPRAGGWILARVKPAEGSPHTRFIPEPPNPRQEGGKSRVRIVEAFEGNLDAAPLPRAGERRTLPYRWESPTPMGGSAEARTYDPFDRHGGLVVCRSNPAAGRVQFEPWYLIPGKWEKWVAPAARRWADEPANRPAAEATKEWEAMVRDENPLLAAAAFRAMVRARADGLGFAAGPIRDARGLRQAIFAYTLLDAATGWDDRAGQAVLADAVDGVTTRVALDGLSLGAFAAARDHTSYGFHAGRAIVRRIASRAAELPVGDEPTLYLDAVLTTAREWPPEATQRG